MIPTHADVLAVIDKAYAEYAVWWRRDHCDDLRATAERHADTGIPYTEPNGGATVTDCYHCGLYWPCPDYQQVIDRLTAWGVLWLRARADAEEGK